MITYRTFMPEPFPFRNSLSAPRYLLADSVSRGGRRMPSRKLMVVDIKRASPNGFCTRSIYIELPGEEPQGGNPWGSLFAPYTGHATHFWHGRRSWKWHECFRI